MPLPADEHDASPDRRSFDRREQDRVGRLEVAVFGLEGDESGGLLRQMTRLNDKLGRIYFALVTASVSFFASAITIAISIVLAG